jgi:signal transduction histidine kinase
MQSVLVHGNRKGVATASSEPNQLVYLVHDIRSIATSVSLMVDLLELAVEAGDDSVQRARAVSARESCHQMAQLCAEIGKQLAETPDEDPEPETFELSEVLVAAVTIYSPIFDLAGKTLRLETRCHPPQLVGNRTQIFRVISNLLDNGLKHTSSGSAVVILCTNTLEEFVVSISDDGPGLDGLDTGKAQQIGGLPLVAKHILNSSAISSPGTGLRCVSDIMTLHNGESRVELNERGGSSFSLLFPKQ